MLNVPYTYFTEGTIFYGLEITEIEGEEAFFLVEVRKRKGELLVTRTLKPRSMEEIGLSIPKDRPVSVCINTANVLSKSMGNASSDHPDSIVDQAFPNLDLGNFYYEVLQLRSSPIVTIAKKEVVDKIIGHIADLKLQVAHFSLGVSDLGNMLAYFKSGSIYTAAHRIHLDNGLISGTNPSETRESMIYDLNGLQLHNAFVLPFSAVLGHLNQRIPHTNYTEVLQKLKWEFKNRRIFGQVAKFSLTFLLTLLLANFLVYQFFHEKVEDLNVAMAATSSQKEELGLLDATVQRKQERAEALGTSSNSRATYYLDRLAQRIPSSVLLNGMTYQPLTKPVRDEKPIVPLDGQLQVSGIAKDTDDFSSWIEELEKYSWIYSVETLDFDYMTKNTSSFLIQIGFHGN